MLSKPAIQKWKGRIYQAVAGQQKHHQRWRDSLDWLNLRYLQRIYKGPETEWTEVHWIWNYFNTLIPTLYAKDPNVQVKSRRKISGPFADTMAENLTYHNEELELKAAVQHAIADTVPYGDGYIDVGYEPTLEEINALNARHQDTKEIRTFQARVSKLLSTVMGKEEEKKASSGTQLLPTIRQGTPFLRWIPAWRVFLCPGYHRLKEMPWVVISEDVEKEDLLRNPRYSKAKIEPLKATRRVSTGTGLIRSGNNPMFANRGGGEIPFIRLWHIWDRRNLEYIVLPDGSEEELLYWPWMVSTNEFLLKQLKFNVIPPSESDPSAYAMDEITPLKPQLIEKSLGRTDMIKARRRAAPLIYLQKNTNNEREAKRLAEAGIANIILLEDISPNSIRGDNPIRIPDDIFRVDQLIDNDLNNVSGFNQLLLSGQSSPDISATEANLAQAGVNLRGVRKIDIVESFIKDIDRTLAMICWEKCDRDEIAQILGKPVSEEMWPDITGLTRVEKIDKISRELDFRIEAHSTQPDQIRLVEQNIAVRNTNMLAAAFPDVINREELLKFHMKKMGDKDIERILKPEGETSRLEAEQENQLLLQGIMQLAHQGDRHDVHITSHGQAAQVAQAQGLDASMIDQHLLMHAQMRQIEQPQAGKGPQAGDTLSPAQAAVPEMQRQGVEKFPDLVGESSNMYANTGSEAPSGL